MSKAPMAVLTPRVPRWVYLAVTEAAARASIMQGQRVSQNQFLNAALMNAAGNVLGEERLSELRRAGLAGVAEQTVVDNPSGVVTLSAIVSGVLPAQKKTGECS